MKNFFKKLSFVLAVAMVLTSIAPATASAAAKDYIYKKGKDAAVESVNVWFGDEATDLNVKINGKKNVAGTWKTGNKKIATIDENGVITPVKNGETKVRFTAETGESVVIALTVGTRVKTVKPYDPAVGTDKLTELALAVGDEKQIYVGLGASAKAKAAGATKTSMKTGYTVDGDAVEVVRDSNQKYTIKAVEAGEATITIGAHKASSLAAGKFFKKAEIKVTVADELNAKQTGAIKITVTGSDLTDDIADYVVKRGTVTVSMSKDVVLNDAKTEAVLTASASVLPAGDYSLSFKKSDAVEFAVETSKVDAIEIVGDTLALTGEIGVASSATVSYKVLNQFDENITKTTNNMSVNTSFGTATAQPATGVITVTNIQNTIIGSTGTVVVVNTATGINATKTLTLGQKAKAASFEVKGVYNQYTAQEMTLVENNLNQGSVLLVSVFDQYGNRMNKLDATTEAAVTFSAGITNVDLTKAPVYDTLVTVDGVDYVALPLVAAAAKAGDATVFFVSRTTGSNSTATITVGGTTTVKTLDVYPLDTVYAGENNEFGYIALTEDGTEVTDYATLSSKTYGVSQMPAGFNWEKNLDGTAKLVYNGSAVVQAGFEYTTVAGTFITAGYGNKTLTFNVYAASVPTSIGGVKDDVVLGLLDEGKSDTSTIALAVKNFVIFDQYGREKDFTSNNEIKMNIAPATTTEDANIALANSEAILLNSATEYNINVTTGAIKAPAKQSYRVVLEKHNATEGKYVEIAGSDNTFTVTVAPMSAVVSFEMEELPMMWVTDNAKYEVAPKVTGKLVDGTEIKIGVSELTLTGDMDLNVVGTGADAKFTASNASLKVDDGEYVKDTTATVTVNDEKGTQMTQTVKVSVQAPTLTTATYKSYVTTVATAGGIEANILNAANFEGWSVKDQYGVNAADKLASDVATILVTDIDSENGKVNNNNTAKAAFNDGWVKNDLFTVTITYKSGLVLTKTFKIQ